MWDARYIKVLDQLVAEPTCLLILYFCCSFFKYVKSFIKSFFWSKGYSRHSSEKSIKFVILLINHRESILFYASPDALSHCKFTPTPSPSMSMANGTNRTRLISRPLCHYFCFETEQVCCSCTLCLYIILRDHSAKFGTYISNFTESILQNPLEANN